MKKTITFITGILFAVNLAAQIKPVKIIKQLDQAEKNKFGIKSLHNLCDLVNTMHDLKKIFS